MLSLEADKIINVIFDYLQVPAQGSEQYSLFVFLVGVAQLEC